MKYIKTFESYIDNNVKVEQMMNMFWGVYIWKHGWELFSKHRFESDANEIEQMILNGSSFEEIKDRIEEQHKTSSSELKTNRL